MDQVNRPTGRPIRVLHLIKGLGPGGAEQLVLNQLAASGGGFDYRVATIVPEKDHGDAEVRRLGATVIKLGPRGWPGRLIPQVRWADVVHAHSPLPASVARLLVAAAPRTAIAVTEHNRWPRHHAATRFFNRLTAPLDDDRIAVSEDVRSSMSPRIAASTDVLTHGVNLDRITASEALRAEVRDELGLAPDDVAIGIVANFRPEKAHDVLLDAFERAASNRAELRLVVVGQGPGESNFRAAVHGSPVTDRIDVLGHRRDVSRLLNGLDAFTLSSRHEGLPVAIMEALAIGLPVIATRAGGIPEAIEHGVSGLLCPIDDPAALADGYVAIADPALRSRMAQAAKSASARFDAAVSTRSIEAMYERLAAGARRGGGEPPSTRR